MQKSQSDVRSQFIVELTHALSVWNFVLNIYEQYGFRRKVPLGEQYIFVSFLNADEITVSVHTGISCFEIEDISAGFHGEPYLGEEEPRAGTIGGSLYLFGRQPNSTFRITPEELLKTSILEIKNSFGSFALPYLDGFQTIFDVWRNLYTPSSEITLRLLRTMPTHGRIERAIIAAFLTRNKAIFNDTVANLAWEARHALPEIQQQSIKRLIEYLNNL